MPRILSCQIVMPLQEAASQVGGEAAASTNGEAVAVGQRRSSGDERFGRLAEPFALLFEALKEDLEDDDFEVRLATDIGTHSYDMQQVYRSILDTHLMIFDLTGCHLEVVYRLGLRHMTGLPALQFATRGQNLPYDLVDFHNVNETIAYTDSGYDLMEARSVFRKKLRAIRMAYADAAQRDGLDPFVGRPVAARLNGMPRLLGQDLDAATLSEYATFLDNRRSRGARRTAEGSPLSPGGPGGLSNGSYRRSSFG